MVPLNESLVVPIYWN
jgi:hypothetical protein